VVLPIFLFFFGLFFVCIYARDLWLCCLLNSFIRSTVNWVLFGPKNWAWQLWFTRHRFNLPAVTLQKIKENIATGGRAFSLQGGIRCVYAMKTEDETRWANACHWQPTIYIGMFAGSICKKPPSSFNVIKVHFPRHLGAGGKLAERICNILVIYLLICQPILRENSACKSSWQCEYL